jgi:hypothetical protein
MHLVSLDFGLKAVRLSICGSKNMEVYLTVPNSSGIQIIPFHLISDRHLVYAFLVSLFSSKLEAEIGRHHVL